MLNNWLKNALNVIYPRQCALCGAAGWQDRDLCRDCYAELPVNHGACQRCAIPLPIIVESTDKIQRLTCGQCQQQEPHFDACYSAFIYQLPIDKLIHQFKFQRKLHLASLLGNLMAEALACRLTDPRPMPDCIVAVPLHRSRLRERGYNQALELARPIAKRFNLPLLSDGCVRNKATVPQSELPAHERRHNIKDSFSVKRNFSARHVAIVDDVMTTGSTLDELAKTFKKAGVQTVEAWICARAKRHL